MIIFQPIRKILYFYDRINYYIMFISIASISLIVFVNVILRYFFSYSLSWSIEVPLYLMIWSAGVGSRAALKSGDFIKFDYLQNKILVDKPRLFYGLRVFILLIMCIYLVYVIIYGVHLCISVYRHLTPMLQISMSIPYSAIPFGAFLMLITLFEEMFDMVAQQGDER